MSAYPVTTKAQVGRETHEAHDRSLAEGDGQAQRGDALVAVRTAKGSTYKVDVENAADIDGIRRELVSLGVPAGTVAQSLIISKDPIREIDEAIEGWHPLPTPTTPPIPQPPDAQTLPPDTSAKIIVARADLEEPYLQVGGDEGDFVAVKTLEEYGLTPDFPSVGMAYRRYWINTVSFVIPGPQAFERSVTTTVGMSDTVTRKLGGELGVEVGGLSAKLSAEFQTEFTVSSETTIQDTFKFEVPEGKIAIWTFWQLQNEVVMLDPAGNLLEYEGKWQVGPLSIPVRWVISLARQATPAYAPNLVLFDAA